MGKHEHEHEEHEETRASGQPTGSAGWLLVAEGMSGTCVVLDFDPGCGAIAWALDAVGGDNAEEIGLTDTPGEPGVFVAWITDMDADGYMTVDSFEEVGPGWEWLGLTPARCSHIYAPEPRGPFRLGRPRESQNLRCCMCGWQLERELDLWCLREEIERMARSETQEVSRG